jgi:AraC-like DNA-binding protein
MITLQTYIPQNIKQLVKSFWFLEVNTGDYFYEEDIIPDGHHEIIFHVNNGSAQRKLHNDIWVNEPRTFIAAQTVNSYQLRLLSGSRLYGIRFYPHTLYALTRVPLSALTNQSYALDDVVSNLQLNNCITENPQQTFLNFEQLLLQHISGLSVDYPGYSYIQASVGAILNQNGLVTVDELIRKTGISGRYLDTLFDKYIGLGPKMMARIIQLNHFITYRTAHPEKTLTECAYEAGYYDQAHLTKSFHSLTNQTPGNYFRNKGYINDHFAGL